jgi:ATPase subunit of ABC transporter with duplicated ATPase domains
MSHVAVSELEYAPPGGETLFFDVSFSVSPGGHVAIVGDNGGGKSSLLKILAGELAADAGEHALGGRALHMAQDVGFTRPDQTVREMLLDVAPADLRAAGRRVLAAERQLAAGDADAGMDLATAIGDWGDLGGYPLEQRWDTSTQRIVRSSFAEVGERRATQLSGGERKQLVLDLLFSSDADILLLDEPDNYLDIPAKGWLEDLLNASRKTVVLVSHDRVLLRRAVTSIVTLEGTGAWVHGESYTTYDEARRRRQERLGDALGRWEDEERRLFRHYKIMKQRAALNFKNASKANAAESRWQRFVAAGPPPPPAPEQKITMRLTGSDSARRVVRLDRVEIPGLIAPFSDEVHFGERLGLVGPNGSGKTHLLTLLAGGPVDHGGALTLGNRTSAGLFTQVSSRPDLAGRQVLDIVQAQVSEEQKAMAALARYGLQRTARQAFDTLSGGQKARLEILCLELEGHNLLLLDEPTDNLDIDSSEALERALGTFEGTVVAVSHDRAFLAHLQRFLLVLHDGRVYELPDVDTALDALRRPDQIATIRYAKPLTDPA